VGGDAREHEDAGADDGPIPRAESWTGPSTAQRSPSSPRTTSHRLAREERLWPSSLPWLEVLDAATRRVKEVLASPKSIDVLGS
jgi:hypothetical protein